MTIHVIGSRGMLGKALIWEAGTGSRRAELRPWAQKMATATQLLVPLEPEIKPGDVIINAAGSIPAKAENASTMVWANACLPHLLDELAERHGAWLIQVSTDCVYGRHQVDPSIRLHRSLAPAPDDLYGRSKLAGEVTHGLNVRTSFVGPDHGLWEWIERQPRGVIVPGWANHIWAGSTVWAVAQFLMTLAVRPKPRSGAVVHLATAETVTKLEVVRMLAKFLHRDDLRIEVDDVPIANRGLEPAWNEAILPSLQEALDNAPFV